MSSITGKCHSAKRIEKKEDLSSIKYRRIRTRIDLERTFEQK